MLQADLLCGLYVYFPSVLALYPLRESGVVLRRCSKRISSKSSSSSSTSAAASRPRAHAAAANQGILKFYTEDAPGLRMYAMHCR